MAMDYEQSIDDVRKVLSSQNFKYDYTVRPCGLSALKRS